MFNMTNESHLWDLSGVTRDAVLEGQWRAGTLYVPETEIRRNREFGQCLYWKSPYEKKPPGRKLLDEFLRLREASDGHVLRYASRWGVLGTWQFRNFGNRSWLASGGAWIGKFAQRWPGYHWEPIDLWRHVARRFHSLITIAAHVHQAEEVPTELWQELSFAAPKAVVEPDPIDGPVRVLREKQFLDKLAAARTPATKPVSPELAWGSVIAELNRLFTMAALQPWLTDSGKGRCKMTFEGLSVGNLLGYLICQLFQAVMAPAGLAECSSCHVRYTRFKRAARGRRNFCEECTKRKIPQQLASADYRARKRAG